MLLNVEKSGEQDQERSYKWLVNKDPGNHRSIFSTQIMMEMHEAYFCQSVGRTRTHCQDCCLV